MSSIRDEKIDLLSTKDQNFHGRRITNAGDAVGQGDYVTLRQIPSPGLDFATVKIFFTNLLNKLLNGNTVTFGINDSIITIGSAASQIGFFGATPASKQTLSAYSSNSQNIAYAGIATGVGGIPYAQVSDLNALRVAYQNLLASYDDIRTKLENTTLVG